MDNLNILAVVLVASSIALTNIALCVASSRADERNKRMRGEE